MKKLAGSLLILLFVMPAMATGVEDLGRHSGEGGGQHHTSPGGSAYQHKGTRGSRGSYHHNTTGGSGTTESNSTANGGDSNSNSGSTSGSTAHSQSNNSNDSQANATADQKIGDQILQLETFYESSSSASADLMLAYCSDGSSGGYQAGGFAVGQVNYICESQMAINMLLAVVSAETSAAIACNCKGEQATGHLWRAHVALLKIQNIQTEVAEYIDVRGETAIVGAVTRDYSLLLAILGLLILL